MGEPRYHQIISPELIQRGRDFLDNLQPKNLVKAAGVLALAGVASLPIVSYEASPAPVAEIGTACLDTDCDTQVLATPAIVKNTVPVAESKPAPEEVAKPEIPPIEGINAVVNERMRAMKLSPEGLKHFLATINTSFIPYAAQHAEFNPKLNRKTQGKTTGITLHVTGLHFNESGPAPDATGKSSPREFANMISGRYGSVLTPQASSCCASQGFIDREGNAFLMTPMNAKVQHNPPHDVNEFGIEVEGRNMEQLTTKQYEALEYFSIMVEIYEKLQDPNATKGHAERRQALLNQNPGLDQSKFPAKPDFPAAESELFRQMKAKFYRDYPAVRQMPLPQLP